MRVQSPMAGPLGRMSDGGKGVNPHDVEGVKLPLKTRCATLPTALASLRPDPMRARTTPTG